MFFVDKPYLSDSFKAMLVEHRIPVVDTPGARGMNLLPGTLVIPEEEARRRLLCGDERPYSTSENCLEWIGKQLPGSALHESIRSFKDKARFRRETAELFPRFFFAEFALDELAGVDVLTFPGRVVLKPAVGFFSMGVHVVSSQDEWDEAVASICANLAECETLYPSEVVEWGRFIVEEYIAGDEFALDAYYDEAGTAQVMGILHHHFASVDDVSDRVYCTSKQIVADHLEAFRVFAQTVGSCLRIKNFPVHIELRRQEDGRLVPIEFNPMRFGGWCTTGDLTRAAFKYDPYVAYHLNRPPDWTELLASKGDEIHSLVVLDNSTGWAGEAIESFDYEAVAGAFEKTLELREVDYRRFPVFGFLLTETRADRTDELDRILHNDLRSFTTKKKA
ncbi:ATP-grasp domain-containing protein [Pontiella sp.]|uniref:ATP-grasp domain-containing protein n=1 Tax=Pontiella sp. TaxID=2837462 RepID=UPI003569B993